MTYPCKTNNYLHLGGLLHHGQDQRKEVKRRLALAHAAFNQHRRVLYHNERISQEKQSDLFQVLLVSKLLYGSESWSITDNRTVSTFSAAILKLYKRLLRVRPDEHLHHDALLAQIGLPSPDVLLRRQRLRYSGTILHCGASTEWGLLSADKDWCRSVESDLIWMWEQLQRSSNLPSPDRGSGQWRHFLLHHPRYWKRLIRRAVTHAVLQHQRKWNVQQLKWNVQQLSPLACSTVYGGDLSC